MPKKKKDDSTKVEERWVEWSDLEAGVKLKAGHPVILFLGGVKPHQTGPGTSPGDLSGPGPHTGPGDHSGPGHHTGPGDHTGPGHHTGPGDHSGPGHHTGPGDHSGPGHHTGPGDHSGPGHHTGPGDHSGPGHHTGTPPPGVHITQLAAEHFATAKAFPLPFPEAIKAFQDITALVKKEPNRQLLILGHTDRAGGDAYNLPLSDERASTAKAFLKNDSATWLKFYSHSDPQKRWGMIEDQWMLQVAKDSTGTSYYTRTPSAVTNADFKSGLTRFQKDNSIIASGQADPKTRTALILAYMKTEGTTVPDSTRIESLGCGMRNLLEPGGPQDNPNNRRVEIYAFPGAITPDPSAWKSDNMGTWTKWHSAATPIDGANDPLSASEVAEDPNG